MAPIWDIHNWNKLIENGFDIIEEMIFIRYDVRLFEISNSAKLIH